jgi:hypothetical protein
MQSLILKLNAFRAHAPMAGLAVDVGSDSSMFRTCRLSFARAGHEPLRLVEADVQSVRRKWTTQS